MDRCEKKLMNMGDVLDEYLTHLNCHCSDGSCVFRPSDMKGMVTNGGCKCCGDYNKKTELERLLRFMKGKLLS